MVGSQSATSVASAVLTEVLMAYGPIRVESDIVAAWTTAWTTARAMARAQGFHPTKQGRLATAVSELTRNVLNHAGEGTCVLSVHVETHGPTVEVAV